MVNVRMPNGDVVAFPDSMSKEEIRALIEKKFPDVAVQAAPSPAPVQQAAPPKTLWERTVDNYNKRDQYIKDTNAKDLSGVAKNVSALGQAGMFVSDTLGDAILTGASELTPDVIEKPVTETIRNAYDSAANSGPGKIIGQGVDVARQGWGNFKETFPDAAEITEGIAGSLMGVAPFTSTGRDIAKKAVEKTAEATISPLTTTIDLKDMIKGMATKSPEAIKSDLVNLRNYTNKFINDTKIANVRANAAKSNAIVDSVHKEIFDNPAYRGVSGERADLYRKVTDEFERFFESAAKSNGELSIPDIDASRAQLNRIWAESLDAQGKPSPEGTLALRVSRLLRSEIEKMTDADIIGDPKQIKNSIDAAKGYAQLSKAEEIAEMVLKADGDPKKLKRLMTNFYLESENLVGYSKKEVAAIKKMKKSSTFEDILGGIASAAPDIRNPRGAVFGTAMLAGPLVLAGMNPLVAGSLVAAGSTVARSAYSPLVTQRAKNVIETIGRSNPLIGKK